MKRSRMRGGDSSAAGVTPLPATRRMSVIAQDPSVRHADGRIVMAKIDVPAEDLIPGPIGYRVQVVDYDTSAGHYHGAHTLPASLDEEPEAWQGGRASIVDDYRFHAQNVYALVMKTLARFEFALGRRIGWSFKVHQLKVAPHGLMDANAFYSRHEEGLVLGHFPGKSGRTVYTCLSHDVVVHETTHALVDALRERYLDPSGPDQAAFHEGFADIIALLSVFSQVELVAELLRVNSRQSRQAGYIGDREVSSEVLKESVFAGLADEMGQEMEGIRGAALRQSTKIDPSPKWLADAEFQEPHRRGEILVAAVMNGFLEAWTERLSKAKVPGQRLHAILRVAEEGADIAAALATMWIRALDYMPPVHLEFGDALSAALTADLEVRPDDSRFKLRQHMLQSCAAYGITPASRRRDVPGVWEPAPGGLRFDRVRFESMRTDKDEIFRFLWENRDRLEIRVGAYTEVLSVRPCMRIGIDGFTLRETVAEYYQVARFTPAELKAKGIALPPEYLAELRRLRREAAKKRTRTLRSAPGDGDDTDRPVNGQEEDEDDPTTPVYGGGVLIFDEYGKLKYWIHNDIFGGRQTQRLQYLWEVGQLRAGAKGARLAAELLSELHRQRAIDSRRFPQEGW
jgi:hypothetical protein